MTSCRTTICSVVIAIFLFTALSHAQLAGDAEPRIVALDPRWTVSLTSPAIAPPGFDQQMAYVPLDNGDVIAIDLDEGRVAWTLGLSTTVTPATGDGMVFVAADALVIAVEQSTGRTLWRTSLGARLNASVYWEGGAVLASTESGELVAIHTDDGHVVWRAPLGAPISVAPSASAERLFVALADGRVVALDQSNGNLLWTLDLQQDITGILALDEQLLVGTRANRLHSITPDRGRIRWSQRAGADVIGAPAADESHIYFVAFDNILRALHRRSGNVRWLRKLPSRPSGGALRADDVVLVPFSTNDIGAYLASTGAPSFTIQAVGELAGAPFLRDDGRQTTPRLIAISREGALQGFAPRVEPPPAPLAELPGVRVGG